MITLLKYFPWVTAAGGEFKTPWVHYPSELGDCELLIVCEARDTGSVDVLVSSSPDGVYSVATAAAVTVNAAGITQDVVNVHGSMVNVQLNSAAQTYLTLSVYLVPKQS